MILLQIYCFLWIRNVVNVLCISARTTERIVFIYFVWCGLVFLYVFSLFFSWCCSYAFSYTDCIVGKLFATYDVSVLWLIDWLIWCDVSRTGKTVLSFIFRLATGPRTSGSGALSTMRSSAVIQQDVRPSDRAVLWAVDPHSGLIISLTQRYF